MAVDPSVIMGGVTPNSGQAIRQATADRAALDASGVETVSKQNILATQMLSAAAGTNDQGMWDRTRQSLAQHGIDISNIPADVAQGAAWAQAGRLAQSPLGSLLNTATKLDANQIAANNAAGNATPDANAHTHALLRTGVTQMYGPAAGEIFDKNFPLGAIQTPQSVPTSGGQPMTPENAETITSMFDPTNTIPAAPQAKPAPAAQPTAVTPQQAEKIVQNTTEDASPMLNGKPLAAQVNPQQAQNADATNKAIMEHYNTMDARDKARIQSVAQGASQLIPFLQKNDADGAMKFLLQRKQELARQAAAGQVVDTEDTDAAIEMVRTGQLDQLKQQVGAIMAYSGVVNPPQGGNTPQGPQNAPQGGKLLVDAPPKFVPPPYDPNKTQAANQAAYQQALEAYKADPATVAANARATAKGAEDVKTDMSVAQTSEMYNKLYENLEAMRKLIPQMPQQGLILNAEDKAKLSQRAGKGNIINDLVGDNQQYADAWNQWNQINHAQVLNGLSQLVATGGNIRSNKVIAKMVEEGNGIPANASPEAKNAMIDNLEAELRNAQAQAEGVKSQTQGTQRPNYSNIPAQLGAPADAAPKGGISIKRIK